MIADSVASICFKMLRLNLAGDTCQVIRRTKKNPPEAGFLSAAERSGTPNIRCLLALRTLRNVEGNLLALFEGLESAHGNRGKMREKIFAAIIRCNKTKTLGVVEPLNCTCCHIATSLKRD